MSAKSLRSAAATVHNASLDALRPLLVAGGLALATGLAAGVAWGLAAATIGFLAPVLAWGVAWCVYRAALDGATASGPATVAVLGLAVVPLGVPDLVLRELSERRAMMILVSAAVWFLVYLALAHPKSARLVDALDRHALPLLLAVCALWGSTAIGILVVKYGRSLDHFTGHDTAYYVQLLWNALHGSPLQGTVLHELNFDPPIRTSLGAHVDLLHLALLPAFALAPGPLVLAGVRTVALAGAAIPIFWVLKRTGGGAFGLGGALIYLLYPTTAAQAIGGFYPVHLAVPLLVLAFCFYRSGRFGPFMVFLLLTISAREDVALMMSAFGILAWLERRAFPWILVPLGLCLGWWAVSYYVVMPAFGAGNGLGYRAVASLAGNAGEAPLRVLGTMASLATLNYVYQMLKPAAFTVLADPASMLLLPVTAMNVALSIPFQGTPLKIHSYHSSIVPAIVAVGLIGAARLAHGLAWTGVAPASRRLAVLGLGLPLLVLAAKDAVSMPLARLPAATPPPSQLLRLIPDAASVAAPINLLPTLATRKQAYWVERLPDYSVAIRPDLVVVATHTSAFDHLDILRRPGARERYDHFVASLETDGYRRAWEGGGYTLYARR